MSDQRYFGLVTNTGLAKLRAAALGEPLLLSHVAFGDGGGVETAPAVTATALVNERYRGPVSDLLPHETNPGILYIEGVIPAGTGGWTMREAGVYDSEGDLIVIAKPPAMDIALIAEGASVEGLVRLPLVFESRESVSLLIDPSIVISTQRWALERLLSRAFLTVDSVTTGTPPMVPGQHVVYYVPEGSTGPWASRAHHLAWYLGASWIFIAPPTGSIFAARDTGKYWRKTAEGLAEWVASTTRRGIVELATSAETLALTDAERAVTPAGLGAVTSQLVHLLTGDLTLWIRTDGDDFNDGSANSSGRAFKSLNGALDYVRQRYVGSGSIITLRFGNPGIYDGLSIGRYGGALRIEGADSATYVIRSPSGAPYVIASQAESLTVSGVTLDYVYSGAAVPVEATLRASPGGTIFAQDIRYRCATNRPALSHNYVDFQSAIRLLGAIAVMGAGRFGRFVAVGNNGVFSGAAGGSPTAISTEGNVPVDDAWVWAHTGGIADFYNVIFSGAFATGKRYTAERGGGISVAGGGASFLPGTIAGTADAASGGWYA